MDGTTALRVLACAFWVALIFVVANLAHTLRAKNKADMSHLKALLKRRGESQQKGTSDEE